MGLFIALLDLGRPAVAQGIARQIQAIEAEHGAEPEQVISRIVALEVPARKAGGTDLRVFLAAWGYAHAALDRTGEADAAATELTELASRSQDHATIASALALRASMLQLRGRFRLAADLIEQANESLSLVQDQDLTYWIAMTAGDIAAQLGRLGESLGHYETALLAAGGNARRAAQAQLAMSPVHLVLGSQRAAITAAQKAGHLARRGNQPGLLITAEVLKMAASQPDGHLVPTAQAPKAPQSGAAQRTPGQAVLNPIAGGPQWLSTRLELMLYLASLREGLHQHERALRLAEQSLSQAAVQGDELSVARSHMAMARALIGLERHAEGRQRAEAGLSVLRRSGQRQTLLLQLHLLARSMELSGDMRSAMAVQEEADGLDQELSRDAWLSMVRDMKLRSRKLSEQHQLERLRQQHALQSETLAHQQTAQWWSWLLMAVLALGIVAVSWLYSRVRRINRVLANRNGRLKHLTLHDRTTGLPNRRAMERQLRRLGQERFHGIGIAIKRFGLVVGSLGHERGDELLRDIGRRLKRTVTERGGELYRLDGLAFCCIVPTDTLAGELPELLTAMTGSMHAPFRIGGQDLHVTVAVGAAEQLDGRVDAHDLARRIELASRLARAQPGNGSLICTEAMLEDERLQLAMEHQLTHAMERSEFIVHYQGQRSLADSRLIGFEALLRWHSPNGPVSPARFIPMAEESGLIVPLGAWVLEQACRQARRWLDDGLGRHVVAVNISPRQFQDAGFIDTVARVLSETGVDPAQIELEITEGAVMDSAETTVDQLRALRAMGLKLAIDDFGTGYASLSYLRQFPLNRLKIDRSFISQIAHQSQDKAIVRALIQMAHSLGLEVIAEGVEQADQEQCLQEMGCDAMQGYLHMRPELAASVTAMLALAAGRPEATPGGVLALS